MKKGLSKEDIFNERVKVVSEYLAQRLSKDNAIDLGTEIIRGADGGSEILDFKEWLEKRFIPQVVWLEKDDYARAITRALPQALRFAGSDFGSTRQRDLGQLWTDTARGFLGEIAFKRFIETNFGIELQQDISIDKLIDDYISSDIKAVKEAQTDYRPPKINVSVKTGKFNARWMDEYSAAKIKNVDAFVFVRAGTAREHFVAFLKAVSFLKSKLFPMAEELGELTPESSAKLWDAIPEFEAVPAYVSGFLMKKDLNMPIHSIEFELKGQENYRGKGKDTRKILINRGVGIFTRQTLLNIPELKQINPEGNIQMLIGGINSEVGDKDHFYANTGSFSFGLGNWRNFVNQL